MSKPAIHLTVDDADMDVREVGGEDGEFVFKTPCLITGLGAGVSSAMLGYVFGFGGYWVSQRTAGVLKLANQSGVHSAKTFSILGGLYAGVSCFMQRLRQKNDAVNAGVSGCSTGLVLGWGSGGWVGGLQSCVMFGLFSYMLDGSGMTGGSAEASVVKATRWQKGTREREIRRVLMAALPLNGDYFR